MRYFDWLHVGVIHEDSTFYTIALEALNTHFQNNIPGAMLLATQGATSHLDLESKVADVRIFVVFAPENMAPAIMCAADRLGLTGPQYQWILLGDYAEDWWKQPTVLSPLLRQKVFCLEQDMQRAIESTLILTQDQGMSSATHMIQGELTKEEFWSEFITFFNTTNFDVERATWVPSTYDAVWSIALALNKSLAATVDPTDGNAMTGLSARLNSAMEMLDFQGATGRVTFTPDRHSQYPPATHISQMQDGKIIFIGVHNERNETLNLNSKLRWQSATGPPRDRPKLSLETVEISLVGIMLFLVSVGIILCGVMAVINCYYRNHKVIKASSPYINFLIIIGCAMGFASVVFISIENVDFYLVISPKAYPFLCNIRPWLLSLGYTFAFGALFAKTWRIYSIFKNPWKKNRPLQDRVLIAIVGVLAGIDVFILVLWLVIDPLDIYSFPVDINVESFTQEVHLVCSDRNLLSLTSADFTIWIIILMVMKGFLLLFGLFLVSQTAKIKAEFFQDSKYMGIAIYGVGICCALGVPTALILMYSLVEDVGYIIATATITFCSYLILFMVFIPKIILLRKYKVKVPTSILLGLNPSFRVRGSRAPYLAHKKSRKLQLSSVTRTKDSIAQCASDISILDASSQASTDLLDDCSDKDISCIQILEGWEASVETHSVEKSAVEICEREIEFEGISYIASVAVEKDPDCHSTSTDQADSTGALVMIEGQVSSDCNNYCKESVLVDHESPTLRSCSYYSMEYATTCTVEVHEEC
jgi:gamma-aminobutyric acid type B receptor